MKKQLVDDREYTLLLMVAHYNDKLFKVENTTPFKAFDNPQEGKVKTKLKECTGLLKSFYNDTLDEEIYTTWQSKVDSELSLQEEETLSIETTSTKDSTTTSESSPTTN